MGDDSAWFRAFRNRLAATIPDISQRLIVLPYLNKNQFFGLLKRADAVLDTVHFGGGNTCLDAFAVGSPVVTEPGRFFRGRATAAKYLQMGVTGLTVSSEQEYVDLAVNLATDASLRARHSKELRENYHRLLLPKDLLSEYEHHFSSLIASAT